MSLFSPAMSVLAQQQPQYNALRIQTSTYGMVIPVVFGWTRVTGNLIWYGDFKAIPHVQSQGGKGGRGSQVSTSYTFSASFAMAICEGPIEGFGKVWRDKNIYDAPQDEFTIFLGSYPQAPWTHYATTQTGKVSESVPASSPWEIALPVDSSDFIADLGVMVAYWDNSPTFLPMIKVAYPPTAANEYSQSGNIYTFHSSLYDPGIYAYAVATINYTFNPYHNGEGLAYSGVAYIASANLNLGTSNTLPNMSMEVKGKNTAAGLLDACPSDILSTIITDTRIGLGLSSSFLDLTDYHNYTMSAGLLLSAAFTQQKSAQQHIQDVCEQTNSEVVWHDGNKIKIVPYGDESLSGNGHTWDPSIDPIYDLGDDDFICGNDEDPIRVTRGTPADAFNHLEVEVLDRDNGYNPVILQADDQGNIDKFGLRKADPRQYHFINQAVIGQKVVQILLQRALYIRNKYEFTLGWKHCLLEPMDVVTLTDSGLGMNQYPVRIVQMDEDDTGNWTVVAEDFPEGVGHSTLYPGQAASGYQVNYNLDPGDTNVPVVFGATGTLTTSGYEIWAAFAGGPNWGGCNVWISTDNATYKNVGRCQGGSRYGGLTATLASGSDPDTTNTCSVDLAPSGGELISGTQSDVDNLLTLCLLGGELIAFKTATLVSNKQYNLTYLRRGAYGSTISSHTAGEFFARLDDGIVKIPYSSSLLGSTVYLKMTSFNIYGMAEQSLAEATAYSFPLALGPGEVAKITTVSEYSTSDLSLTVRGNNVLTGGNTVRKVNGSNAWDSDFYSAESYTGGAYLSFTCPDDPAGVVCGLNTDPTTDQGYVSIDYGFLISGTIVYAAESGNLINLAAHSPSNRYEIKYDEVNVYYYVNGTLFRGPIAASPALKFYLDGSMYSVGGSVENIRFGTVTSNLWSKVGGEGKPEDYADVTPANPSDSDLVAYWSFDEGSGLSVYDLSSYENTANIANSANVSWESPGVRGGFMFFSGTANGYVQAANSASLDMGTNNFSIAYWVARMANSIQGVIVDKRVSGGAYTGYIVYHGEPAGALVLQLNDGNNFHFYSTYNYVEDVGNWAHVAISINRGNNTVKFYKNGNQIDTADCSNTVGSISSNTVLTLGGGAISPQYSLYGSLDEVFIYKKELTAAEVMALYKFRSGGAMIPGTSVANNSLTGNQIANGTITGEKIANATITGPLIVANTITGNLLVSQTITANQIANATITGAQLILRGTGKMINLDPDLNDSTMWEVEYGSGGIVNLTGPEGDKWLAGSMGSQLFIRDINFYPINANKTYRTRFWGLSSGNENGLLYFCLQQYKSANANDYCDVNEGKSPYQPAGVDVPNYAVEYSNSWGPAQWQTGVKFVRLAFLLNWSGNTGQVLIQKPRFEEMMNATEFIVENTINANLIQNATITANQIANGTITATQIGNATITGNQIASASITALQIANLTLTANQIANQTITATQIGNAAIGANQIGNQVIIATHISAGANILGSQLASNANIVGTQLSNGTINANQIGLGVITGSLIAANTITGNLLVTNTITANQIANATILGSLIAANTITGNLIVQNTITANQIANATITSTQIAGGANITANQIANATITTVQLAANAVDWPTQITGTGKPENNADVTGTHTASNIAGQGALATLNTITANEITNATITATQIANATITANQIANLTITGGKIANATIDSAKISSLDANVINAGIITGRTLQTSSNANAQRFVVSANTGEAYFYGDANAGVEEVASIGLKILGSDMYVGVFGSVTSGVQAMGVLGQSYHNPGVVGRSIESAGLYGEAGTNGVALMLSTTGSSNAPGYNAYGGSFVIDENYRPYYRNYPGGWGNQWARIPFFTTGTYDGNESANRAIAHKLGVAPALVMIFGTSNDIYNGQIYLIFGTSGFISAVHEYPRAVAPANMTYFYVGNANNWLYSAQYGVANYTWIAFG